MSQANGERLSVVSNPVASCYASQVFRSASDCHRISKIHSHRAIFQTDLTGMVLRNSSGVIVPAMLTPLPGSG